MRGILIFMYVGAVLTLQGCAGPQAKTGEAQTFLLSAHIPIKPVSNSGKLTLLVSPMRAHPGFDTPRMAYLREAHHLEYFAYHRWVEAPARMLTPLLTQALEGSGQFRAVAQAPGAVHAQLRLDTELVRLVQDFNQKPNVVILQMRAQLIDTQKAAILASRQFETQVAVSAENAPAGVAAINQALPALLGQVAQWVAQVNAP